MAEDGARRTKGANRRQQILDAAAHEFGLRGVAEVRIEDVAARAGCNKSLVYYYFESKEHLHAAVIAEIAEIMRTNHLHWKGATFPEWASYTIEWAWKHPDDPWARMVVREGLTDQGRALLEEERTRTLGEVTKVVVRGQGKGDVDPDLDPEMVTFLLLLLTIGPGVTPQLVRMLTGVSPADPQFYERYRTFVASLVERLRPAQGEAER
ncbi:TetR/AcrR family transcriptional regulator [Streptomyces sp. JV176]|uniref:TetR/AcrR family transcriptional regulator n=1 Tax=Streptomyces sp. JV176 TaxID=858630 RepID=UPI002E78FF78|nr:TetR/AcrR family transcriptional regulator [Streptomyces sp. JV176]MEE1799497.1 TetR/AcrR family transcriptional regulator [Streptomyces sp. JV176]